MTGVAGDAGLLDVGLPVGVDVARHLQHPAGDGLGVKTVVGHILDIVAVAAALLGGDPLGHRRHQAVELVGAEIGQHLDVLVFVDRKRPAGRDRVKGRRYHVVVSKVAVGTRVGDGDKAEPTVAQLLGCRRRAFAPRRQSGNRQNGH